MTDQKNIRTHIEEHLDAIATDPEKAKKLSDILDRALGQKKGDWAVINCKHCRRDGKYWVEHPVTANDVKAIKELVELTKGRVAQKVDVTHTVQFDVPMGDWTMDQLREVASMEVQEVIEDGDYEVLGLPQAGPDSTG